FHTLLPRGLLGGTSLSRFRASSIPVVVVQDRLCSVHAAPAVSGKLRRLCCVKVNLTIGLAGPTELNKVTLTPARKLFQVAAVRRYTGGVKQFGHRAGWGGDTPSSATRSAVQGRMFSASALFRPKSAVSVAVQRKARPCALAQCGQSRLSELVT